jgi:protein SCO1/2
MMNKFWIFGTGVVIGLAAVLIAGWYLLQSEYRYQGVVIDPPAPAADFTLTDQNGQAFRLSEQQGKVVLIFFGYTNCPDVCPITLSEYKKIKALLGDQADQVVFIYITVDPERDTVERMKAYLPNFDASFTGLTGDRETLQPVWAAYGVYQQKQDSGSAAGYLVDHSARMYVIDPQGKWRINYPFGMEPEKIAQDLKHLIAEARQN